MDKQYISMYQHILIVDNHHYKYMIMNQLIIDYYVVDNEYIDYLVDNNRLRLDIYIDQWLASRLVNYLDDYLVVYLGKK